MRLRILHLNIEEGKLLEEIVTYVLTKDFDILLFQEVTGGMHNVRGLDSFSVLKGHLGYDGVQGVSWRLAGDPSTYFSNAVLYKPSLTLDASHVIYLKPYAETTEETMRQYLDHPHCAIDAVFSFTGKKLHCISTHLAWGPTPEDKPYKVEQGKVLYEYIKSLTEPFVLSGDFNLTPDSQVVRWINELGRNHTVENTITNTLNPHTHRVKELFPQGLAVDYIFTEKSLKVRDFHLVDTPDLSDHLGLAVTIEI